ncbi:hypothetical protein QQF64_020280 [Cirrhinus molitorella]|uniref:Uncharacterized protein n=2 Tax=Cirrhinus molitorella TaxID=172907 RepID=A0AA88PSQ7_9TELE|nr:hypothetical protein Q8A67_016969 [Cirrhinus molitorella]
MSENRELSYHGHDEIDTNGRECRTIGKDTYAGSDSYAEGFVDESGEIIAKAGAFVEAGVGGARVECSVFEAEAKGPNASAGVEASTSGTEAIVRAELGSVSAQAGPIGVKVGLGVDTGVSASPCGVEVKILGTGVSLGKKTSISVLGSEVSCSVM